MDTQKIIANTAGGVSAAISVPIMLEIFNEVAANIIEVGPIAFEMGAFIMLVSVYGAFRGGQFIANKLSSKKNHNTLETPQP
ncbi:MAG TPA: hypothetical protein PLK94_12475 [Alphaproteobacteria bacterium]|nr:hypothetical protein [Alphaproteobacteria bacterium]HOO52095.1 hypothetical protein [Alphaproteobacteria bacterium]